MQLRRTILYVKADRPPAWKTKGRSSVKPNLDRLFLSIKKCICHIQKSTNHIQRSTSHDIRNSGKIADDRRIENNSQIAHPASTGEIRYRRNSRTPVQYLNRRDLPDRMLSVHGLRARQRHQPLCQLRRFSPYFRSKADRTSRFWQMVQTLEKQASTSILDEILHPQVQKSSFS